ncbi:hypothetical protein DYY66_0193 [Candidatus Nitrosotalea sp. FS]|nr:hypothetical protein [Candidatus Nitrosotalea sp. FS]
MIYGVEKCDSRTRAYKNGKNLINAERLQRHYLLKWKKK